MAGSYHISRNKRFVCAPPVVSVDAGASFPRGEKDESGEPYLNNVVQYLVAIPATAPPYVVRVDTGMRAYVLHKTNTAAGIVV